MPGQFELIFLVVLAAGSILWIFVLLDCLRNEPAEGNDRVVWALVIVFTTIVGALLYLVVRRPQRIRLQGK